MSKIPIAETRIFIDEIAGYDFVIGQNDNRDVNDKIQAFVDCFRTSAAAASAQMHGLPAAFILAQWGAESGWGANPLAVKNQNWGMLKAGGATPSKGRGANGFSVFYGRDTFQAAYVHILNHVSNYAALRAYLRDTPNPSLTACIAWMAESGYCEGSAQSYRDLLHDCVATLRKRSDFFADAAR
ncbi:MAG: glucosaminidase domain-containing protein [Ruthenibacterium sp.]